MARTKTFWKLWGTFKVFPNATFVSSHNPPESAILHFIVNVEFAGDDINCRIIWLLFEKPNAIFFIGIIK